MSELSIKNIGFGKLDAEGAALSLASVGLGFEIMSALNSSPWTAENFGADEAKAASCWKYTVQACVLNAGLGLGASILTETWWPLVGTSAVSAYMAFTYKAALKRGMDNGNTDWQNGSGNAPADTGSTAPTAGARVVQAVGPAAFDLAAA